MVNDDITQLNQHSYNSTLLFMKSVEFALELVTVKGSVSKVMAG